MLRLLNFNIVIALSLFWISSCGVKGPPIAPASKPEPRALVLDCSPYDPKCDEIDKKYIPGLSEDPNLSKKEREKKQKKKQEE